MKSVALLAILGVALLGATVFLSLNSRSVSSPTSNEFIQWMKFKKTFNKDYSEENGMGEAYRLSVFIENLRAIQGIEALGVSEFMDITPEEFAARYLNSMEAEVEDEIIETSNASVAAATVNIDWVAKGAVNTPQDQGSCGGCWTFATTGGAEAANFISTGVLPLLSQQQLLDCDKNNNGCSGGLRDVALNYVIANGLATEDSYPWVKKEGTCHLTMPHPYKVTAYTSIKTCPDLVTAIQKGPVTVGIDAGKLQFYSGGVLSVCGTSINHAVLLVGYNSSDAYWKVKNSWGPNWGEKGYFRLSATVSGGNIANTCALCTRAYFPYGSGK